MRLLDDLWREGGPETRAGRWVGPLARAGAACFRLGVRSRNTCYRRGWIEAERAPLPVVSIGGVEAGGTGKTPLALELARIAARAGFRSAILSRGYGGEGSRSAARVPVPVPPDAALRFGDEPAWLAALGMETGTNVYVARRRIEAARRAWRDGAALAILDDGLQHRRLHRDGEIVSMSARSPLGNGRLLPAGPLREDPEWALRRADRVVLAAADRGEALRAEARIRGLLRPGTEVISWHNEPGLRVPARPGRPAEDGPEAVIEVAGAPAAPDGPAPDEPLFLVAGIAHPERLAASLRVLGRAPAEEWIFRDHHRYRPSDLRAPFRAAREARGWIITTEKDWVRLQALVPPDARIALLTQRLVWDEPEAVAGWTAWLARIVAGAPGFLPGGAQAPLR